MNLAPGRIVDALLSGEVDAVSTWAPYTTILKEKLGRDSSVLDEPGLYRMTWNLVVRKDLAQRDPECIVRFLHALVKANRYIAEDPAGARNVVSRYLKTARLSPKGMGRLQDDGHPCAEPGCEPGGPFAMDDRQGNRQSRPCPQCADFIYVAALKDVQPGAVSIIKKSNSHDAGPQNFALHRMFPPLWPDHQPGLFVSFRSMEDIRGCRRKVSESSTGSMN